MKALVILWCALLFPMLCFGQSNAAVTNVEIESESMQGQADNRAQIKGAYNLRVRYVKVEERWGGQFQLPLAVGDVLTQEKLFQSMEAMEAAITNSSIQGYGHSSKGEIGVLYIDVDFDTSQPSAAAVSEGVENTVGVIFHPYYVRFSLVQLGNNILPIPRSPRPTFYDNVPKPLLTLNPTFGLSYDRNFGTALGAAFETDLLNLSAPGYISSLSNENGHLFLHGQGIKSVEEDFYRTDAGLSYNVRQSGKVLQQFSILADYYGVKEPLGDDQHTRYAGVGNVGITLKLAPNTRLSLNTGYRRTEDRMDSKAASPNTRTSANEQSNRVLFDWIPRPLYGFLRAVVWEDNARLIGDGGGSYQRLVGRVGYAKEIPLFPNQTIGLELLAGGGILWGDAPEYARFFGGNSSGQFLYDSPSSEALLNMPAGPLIRSFGEGAAGFRTPSGGLEGGNAFWHMNLNLTFPIPSLSHALIPNELTDIEDANGNRISLKQLIRRQIDVTGTNMLAGTLKNEGINSAEADKEAEKILDEIRPATHFIIDSANLYSIKPLLMVDVAGMTGRDNSLHNTWLAFGGGVQVTVVIAKFELGYMYTLSGPTFHNRENVFGRIVFQNLF